MLHRIILPDGTIGQSDFLRYTLSLAYALFGLAGLLFVVSGNLISAYGPWANVMAWFLFVGGIGSAVGTFTRRWVGEFVGIPLLASAFIVLGIEVWWTARNSGLVLLAYGNLALLCGLSTVLISRWRSVMAVYRLARAVAEMDVEDDEPGEGSQA